MTVLSTHRYNTYKATPGPYKRDISPKKVLMPSMKNTLLGPFTKSAITIKPSINPPMPTRKIIVFGKEFEVALPVEYDIYEGLRRWYPGLYNIVLIEDSVNRKEEEDDYEEMWAEFDYNEAMNDF